MTIPRIHPAHRVITQAEKAWAKDDEQAGLRAAIVLRALVDSGLLPDAEVFKGVVIQSRVDGSLVARAIAAAMPSPEEIRARL